MICDELMSVDSIVRRFYLLCYEMFKFLKKAGSISTSDVVTNETFGGLHPVKKKL